MGNNLIHYFISNKQAVIGENVYYERLNDKQKLYLTELYSGKTIVIMSNIHKTQEEIAALNKFAMNGNTINTTF